MSRPMPHPRPSTFSIVGFDPKTKDLGIAVESKFVAVGAVVPWAKAGVGAVATQSYANTTYGPKALALLEKGETPEAAMSGITGEDKRAAVRQVGIVNAKGESATFTGEKCNAWAGGVKAANFCC